MMNEHQNRVLWAAALRQLAHAIGAGHVNPPTTVRLWTQYVTPEELMQVADFSGPEPLKINNFQGDMSPTTVVPVGKLIDLDVTWTYQAMPNPDYTEGYELHNRDCLAPMPAGE